MNPKPKFYRIWSATGSCVASHVEAAHPQDALKSVERLLMSGRYLVAKMSTEHCNHDEFGVFEVTHSAVSYTEVKL